MQGSRFGDVQPRSNGWRESSHHWNSPGWQALSSLALSLRRTPRSFQLRHKRCVCNIPGYQYVVALFVAPATCCLGTRTGNAAGPARRGWGSSRYAGSTGKVLPIPRTERSAHPAHAHNCAIQPAPCEYSQVGVRALGACVPVLEGLGSNGEIQFGQVPLKRVANQER